MSNKVIQHWDSRSRDYYAENDTQEIIEKIIHDPGSAFPMIWFIPPTVLAFGSRI